MGLGLGLGVRVRVRVRVRRPAANGASRSIVSPRHSSPG